MFADVTAAAAALLVVGTGLELNVGHYCYSSGSTRGVIGGAGGGQSFQLLVLEVLASTHSFQLLVL